LNPTVIIGLDARGFIFAPALALRLNIRFVPVRKKGKLPGEVIQAEYTKEYGTDMFEMQKGRLTSSDRVVIVDDLIATGTPYFKVNDGRWVSESNWGDSEANGCSVNRVCIYHGIIVLEWVERFGCPSVATYHGECWFKSGLCRRGNKLEYIGRDIQPSTYPGNLEIHLQKATRPPKIDPTVIRSPLLPTLDVLAVLGVAPWLD
jgi:Phosphoribosyl transferase domain